MSRLSLFLLLVCVLCALSTVSSTHQSRKLYTQLEVEQKRMRDLDVEWGQLQLEQSTWATHSRVEKIARERLGMKPPQSGQLITVDPGTGAGR